MTNPYARLLRTAWRHAGPYRGRLALLYGLYVIVNLLALARPAVYGWFVDRIQRDADHWRQLQDEREAAAKQKI